MELSYDYWLLVFFRIRFKIPCLVFESMNGQAPDCLCNAVSQYKRALRSSDQGLLVVPRVHTKKYGERTFALATLHLYNGLPIEIRLAKTLHIYVRVT